MTNCGRGFATGWDGDIVIVLWVHDELVACCRPGDCRAGRRDHAYATPEPAEFYGFKVPLDTSIARPLSPGECRAVFPERAVRASHPWSSNSASPTSWNVSGLHWRLKAIAQHYDTTLTVTGRAQHVIEVAEALRGIVPDIRIITFRDLAEHGDLTDWKERGVDTGDAGALRRRCRDL